MPQTLSSRLQDRLSKAREAQKLPQDARRTQSDINDRQFVTGDFANTNAANTKQPPLSLSERLKKRVESATLGHPKPSAVPVLNQDAVSKVVSRPKSLSERLRDRVSNSTNPLQPQSNEAKKGSPVLAGVIKVLSIDEHLIVKGISNLMGIEEKEDLSDYTWTTLLKDKNGFGLPDNGATEALGLILSIFASPSTYLTFGTGGAIKLGVKGAGKTLLTKRGNKLVNAVIKDRVEKKIPRLAANATKEEIKARQILSKEVVEFQSRIVKKQVTKKFRDIRKSSNKFTLDKDVRGLPSDIFHQGGIRWAGQQILTGKEVAKIAEKAKIPQFFESLRSVEPIGRVFDSVKRTKDFLGKMFIPGFALDAKVLRLFRDFDVRARDFKRRSLQRTEQFFSGLGTKERLDFGESALQASLKSEKRLKTELNNIRRSTGKGVTNEQRVSIIKKIRESTNVRSIDGNKAVQDRLDRFYAQGRFKGRQSVAERFARYANLTDSDEIPIWFPGIDKRFKIESLKMPRDFSSPAVRGSHVKRTGLSPGEYTRDPVKALSYRRIQEGFDNLRDEMYNEMKKRRTGGILTQKEFFALSVVKQAEFAPFVRPFSLDPAKQAIRGVDETVYAPKKMVQEFGDLIGKDIPRIPILSWGTDLFKAGVTTLFPGFHSRNFMSNIVLNSYNIGIKAFNPVAITRSLKAVIQGKKPKTLHDRLVKTSVNATRGTNLDKEIISETGERFTLRDLVDEAKKEGALKDTFFDMAGENLDQAAQDKLHRFLQTVNPLSVEWTPFRWGRKVGTVIEDSARLVNYSTWRQMGLSPKMAAMEANEALFDYAAITKFEQAAKLVIPFYTFSRKNIGAHMKLFAHRPGALGAQLKFFRELGPTNEEWNALPKWTQRRFTVKLQENFMTGFGLPFEDILELAGSEGNEVFTRANPMFKFPLEKFVTKRDTFSGRRLEEINNAQEFKFVFELANDKRLPESIRSGFGVASVFMKLEQTDRGKIVGDPNKIHMLRNSFASRFTSTIGLVEKDDVDGYEASLQLLMGIRKIPPNYSRAVSIFRREQIEGLRKLLVSTNTLRTLDIPIFVGGTKFQRDYANTILLRLRKGQSIQELIAPLLEAEAVIRAEQRGRIRR